MGLVQGLKPGCCFKYFEAKTFHVQDDYLSAIGIVFDDQYLLFAQHLASNMAINWCQRTHPTP